MARSSTVEATRARRPLIFMFGGQGCHYFHMGRGLLDEQPTFRTGLLRGEALFMAITGRSLLKAIYNPGRRKGEPWDDVTQTHAAIFAVEHALAEALLEAGLVPDLVLGYSLGEFAAAALSGLITYEGAFRAVIEQADALVAHCTKAGMTAVLAAEDLFHSEAALFSGHELAAANWRGQFVIAGSFDDLAKSESGLRSRGVAFQRLDVRYGFHSSWMDPLRTRPLVVNEYGNARVPFLSCTTGSGVDVFDSDHIWSVLREPVRFASTLSRFAPPQPAIFLDISPSGTFAGFARSMGSDLSIPAMTPFLDDATTLRRCLQMVKAARDGRGIGDVVLSCT